MPAPDSQDLSPNQRAKRDEIVSAAVEVLLRQGVHGCTVRSIAASAGVSKGSVHYYFGDVDEIVDLAMVRATRGWIAWLRADDSVGPTGSLTPVEVFWRAMAACLEPFTHGDRTLMPLWLEYWAVCTRARRIEPLREVQGLLAAYVAELLAAAAVGDEADRAFAVASYLFGAAMQQSVVAVAPERIRRHIAALCGIDPPDG